jgi:hypothetical protein
MFRGGVATSFVWQSSRNGSKFLGTHLQKVKEIEENLSCLDWQIGTYV